MKMKVVILFLCVAFVIAEENETITDNPNSNLNETSTINDIITETVPNNETLSNKSKTGDEERRVLNNNGNATDHKNTDDQELNSTKVEKIYKNDTIELSPKNDKAMQTDDTSSTSKNDEETNSSEKSPTTTENINDDKSQADPEISARSNNDNQTKPQTDIKSKTKEQNLDFTTKAGKENIPPDPLSKKTNQLKERVDDESNKDVKRDEIVKKEETNVIQNKIENATSPQSYKTPKVSTTTNKDPKENQLDQPKGKSNNMIPNELPDRTVLDNENEDVRNQQKNLETVDPQSKRPQNNLEERAAVDPNYKRIKMENLKPPQLYEARDLSENEYTHNNNYNVGYAANYGVAEEKTNKDVLYSYLPQNQPKPYQPYFPTYQTNMNIKRTISPNTNYPYAINGGAIQIKTLPPTVMTVQDTHYVNPYGRSPYKNANVNYGITENSYNGYYKQNQNPTPYVSSLANLYNQKAMMAAGLQKHLTRGQHSLQGYGIVPSRRLKPHTHYPIYRRTDPNGTKIEENPQEGSSHVDEIPKSTAPEADAIAKNAQSISSDSTNATSLNPLHSRLSDFNTGLQEGVSDPNTIQGPTKKHRHHRKRPKPLYNLGGSNLTVYQPPMRNETTDPTSPTDHLTLKLFGNQNASHIPRHYPQAFNYEDSVHNPQAVNYLQPNFPQITNYPQHLNLVSNSTHQLIPPHLTSPNLLQQVPVAIPAESERLYENPLASYMNQHPARDVQSQQVDQIMQAHPHEPEYYNPQPFPTQPDQNIPQPEKIVPQPGQMVPQPEHIVPQPGQIVPHPVPIVPTHSPPLPTQQPYQLATNKTVESVDVAVASQNTANITVHSPPQNSQKLPQQLVYSAPQIIQQPGVKYVQQPAQYGYVPVQVVPQLTNQPLTDPYKVIYPATQNYQYSNYISDKGYVYYQPLYTNTYPQSVKQNTVPVAKANVVWGYQKEAMAYVPSIAMRRNDNTGVVLDDTKREDSQDYKKADNKQLCVKKPQTKRPKVKHPKNKPEIVIYSPARRSNRVFRRNDPPLRNDDDSESSEEYDY